MLILLVAYNTTFLSYGTPFATISWASIRIKELNATNSNNTFFIFVSLKGYYFCLTLLVNGNLLLTIGTNTIHTASLIMPTIVSDNI